MTGGREPHTGAPQEEPEKDLVMHSFLETDDGYALMAADTPPGMEVAQPSRQITISISGDEFGGFVDKYGVEWLVNIGSPQA